MIMNERNALRRLQDRFLRLPSIVRIVEDNPDALLVGNSSKGATADDLRNFIFPEFAQQIERFLAIHRWER